MVSGAANKVALQEKVFRVNSIFTPAIPFELIVSTAVERLYYTQYVWWLAECPEDGNISWWEAPNWNVNYKSLWITFFWNKLTSKYELLLHGR